MIGQEVLEKELKSNNVKNSYIFCGIDEELIKEGINDIKKRYIDDGLEDLNYMQLDGMTTNCDEIINACETLPFMGEKKVIVVYRCNFLKEKSNSEGTKVFNEVKEYLKNVPPYTILILYYLFDDKRETPKKNKKVMGLDKITNVVYFEKLKGDRYLKKIDDIFRSKGRAINKIELKYFSERVQNNFDVIVREVDKLVNYTHGRDIKREDIDKLLPKSREEDIFDLIDLISQKKIDKALSIVRELLVKSEQHMLIIISLENTFKRLYDIKVAVEKGKSVGDLMSELRLPEFVIKKLVTQSRGFNKRQLMGLIKLCLDSENRVKSSGVDKDMEIELLLLNTLTIK
ncbi:MAG: DNA polymerase III subunit delta [Clostridium sp.]